MARKKEYNESEVIESAMSLFWRNGYTNTSTRMLEKEMGINQFSIYASFGSKHGVFLESIKLYKSKIKEITNALNESENGVEAIKKYFYDFIKFSSNNNKCKGCLLTNTVNELGLEQDKLITKEVFNFTNSLKELFYQKLKESQIKDEKTLESQAAYLMVSMAGLSVVSKVFSKELLNNYIENIFKNM